MNTKDFERLKAVCEKPNPDYKEIASELALIALKLGAEANKRKDPWDGVEFVECVNSNYLESWTIGKVYRLTGKPSEFLPLKDNKLQDANVIEYCSVKFPRNNCFKPSAESAYIEQLKKEAFERHNGRLSSSKIDHSNMDGGEIHFSWETGKDPFLYRKDTDTLYWCGIPIYQSGKWASKLKEMVEVRCDLISQNANGMDAEFSFKLSKPHNFDMIETGNFLAKQLEEYLNKE